MSRTWLIFPVHTQTSEEHNKRRTTPVTFHFLHFVPLCNPTGKNWATHMTAQTNKHRYTLPQMHTQCWSTPTQAHGARLCWWQPFSSSAAVFTPLPLPTRRRRRHRHRPPAASVTFLHGNIVWYEQSSGNLILHEVTPAALITLLFKWNWSQWHIRAERETPESFRSAAEAVNDTCD